MKRAAIYTRVSTSEQASALQIDECTGHVARAGWTLVEHFGDIAVSGLKARRPELDRLLAAARKRRLDVIVVWRADRLFRSLLHMVSTLAELDALHVDFVSCTESFDTTTPAGRLLFHMCSAFAQFERDLIVERTIAGMAAAKRRGAKIGRPRTRFDLELARELLLFRIPMREIARRLNVPKTTLARALRERTP